MTTSDTYDPFRLTELPPDAYVVIIAGNYAQAVNFVRENIPPTFDRKRVITPITTRALYGLPRGRLHHYFTGTYLDRRDLGPLLERLRVLDSREIPHPTGSRQ
jgi:hypothetical protein